MDKTSFIQLFEHNYERMALFFGADVSSNVRIPLAVQFTFSRETFNGLQFEANVEKLHKYQPKQTLIEFLATPSNKSVLTYKVLAHLVLHLEPEQELERLISNEKALVKAGFKNSSYQNIAALFLTDEAHAIRAKTLYEEMKKHHFFLTGKDDIPYAVLLTKQQEDPIRQAKTMRKYYDALSKKGFKGGDALQAATQLLTLYNEAFQPVLVDYVVAIKQSFTSCNIKIKKRFYPYLALLALTAATTGAVDEIIGMKQDLVKLSMYAAEQDYALMTATQYVLQQLIDNDALADFNDSLLFMQALNMSGFINDAAFFGVFDILDIFL
ncbi:DUF4003 family protein [Solibacillus silvestris]|uniref:DUF4003 family protein n=1 Tax=Solibacillus silvestris TaxID=76853 RepID=UPI003F817C61